MSVGCFATTPKDFILFGGSNDLGDKQTKCYTFTIDNEEKPVHRISEADFALDQGDLFPNGGFYVKNGEDYQFMGQTNVWTYRDKSFSRLVAIA